MSERLIGKTVDACIEHHCRLDPATMCLAVWAHGCWKRFSRREFWSEVERYADLFASHFTTSTLLLFVKRLDIHLLAAYVGAIKAGHIPAQLSPLTTKATESEYQRKLDHILAITGATAIFGDDGLKSHREDVQVLTPSSARGDSDGLGLQQATALVQFSSGSTGLQKGVSLTHEALIAHMRRYGTAIELSGRDRLVSWLPLYHDMGLIACYLMPLMWGIPSYHMDPFDWILRPNLLLEAIQQERATICFLPNFAYHVLINKGRPHDLSSMRLFVNCSEPARKSTHEAFSAKFPSVSPEALGVCYALAENTFAVAQTPPGRRVNVRPIGGKETISCGPVLPGTEVTIVEPDESGVGEIRIRGEHLFARFLGSQIDLRDGYYPTGDLGTIIDGELYVTGRKKDLIIANGKNIYPQDVEEACSNVQGVYPGRCVAFGVWSDQSGTEDLLVVVERDGSMADIQLKIAVQRAVEQEVGVLPKRVEVVEHMRLIKTSSGKISRARNKELFLAGELRSS